MKPSDKTLSILNKSKKSELEIYGYPSHQIERDFKSLIDGKEVEVGYRVGCGRTDRTHKVFKEWLKLLKSLRKDGFNIEEINVIHPNKSPTMAQGFWNSVKYIMHNDITTSKNKTK